MRRSEAIRTKANDVMRASRCSVANSPSGGREAAVIQRTRCLFAQRVFQEMESVAR